MKLARAFGLGWALLLLAPALAMAQVGVEYFTTDRVFDLVLSDIVFVAEGRIGDLGGSSTYELGLGGRTGPATTADVAWANNATYAFSLTYNPATHLTTFSLAGHTLTYVTPYSGFDAIFIRSEAVDAGTFVGTYNLVLDGESVHGASVAYGPGGLLIMQIYNAPLSDGFTLTGTAKLKWDGQLPQGSALDFQIRVCHMAVVPNDTPTWGQLKNLYR